PDLVPLMGPCGRSYLYLRKNPRGKTFARPLRRLAYAPLAARANAGILSSRLPFEPLLPPLGGRSHNQESSSCKGVYFVTSSSSISFATLNCSRMPHHTNHLDAALALSGFESMSWSFSVPVWCMRSC